MQTLNSELSQQITSWHGPHFDTLLSLQFPGGVEVVFGLDGADRFCLPAISIVLEVLRHVSQCNILGVLWLACYSYFPFRPTYICHWYFVLSVFVEGDLFFLAASLWSLTVLLLGLSRSQRGVGVFLYHSFIVQVLWHVFSLEVTMWTLCRDELGACYVLPYRHYAWHIVERLETCNVNTKYGILWIYLEHATSFEDTMHGFL